MVYTTVTKPKTEQQERTEFLLLMDPTNDGSIVWPDDRKRVLLSTIRLTKVEPNQDELQRSLTFNPTFLTSGIELSDDPVVPLRSAVYALSVARRH